MNKSKSIKIRVTEDEYNLIVLKARTERINLSEYIRQFRQGILSNENILQYIQDVTEYQGEAVNRNYAVWGYSFNSENLDSRNKLHPDERNPESYEEAVGQMTDELIGRLEWLDENIEVLKQYCHESAVKKFNH